MHGAELHMHRDYCRENCLRLSNHGGTVFHDGEFWCVLHFGSKEDAEKFMSEFGGERMDPRDKGKGASWSRWQGRAAEKTTRRR